MVDTPATVSTAKKHHHVRNFLIGLAVLGAIAGTAIYFIGGSGVQDTKNAIAKVGTQVDNLQLKETIDKLKAEIDSMKTANKTAIIEPVSVAPAPAPAAIAPIEATPACTIPGSVYVEAVGGCVQHVTARADIEPVSPTVKNAKTCAGHPIGYKFDTEVVGPDGRHGIAHHECK